MSTAITIKVCATDERAVVLQRYWDTTRTMFELSQGKPIYATVDLHDKRTSLQNDKMWPMIREIHRHNEWNWSEEISKNILLTECFGERYITKPDGKQQQVFPQTKKFRVKVMIRFLDFLHDYSDQCGITQLVTHDWTER